MENPEKKEVPLWCMFQGPGPAYRLRTCVGNKDHCPTIKQGPSYSIGHRYRDKLDMKPGPMYWYDPKMTSHGKSHIPAIYMSGRPKAKSTTDITPGPGNYDLSNVKGGVLSKEHRPPHISIGGRSRFQERSNAPPPNHYNVTSGIGLRTQTAPIAPSWSIGGRSEVGGSHYSLVKKATPSPANYSTHLPETYNRGFTIQGRTSKKDYRTLKDNPGPNQYDPTHFHALNKQKRGFSMGIRHSKCVMPLIDSTAV